MHEAVKAIALYHKLTPLYKSKSVADQEEGLVFMHIWALRPPSLGFPLFQDTQEGVAPEKGSRSLTWAPAYPALSRAWSSRQLIIDEAVIEETFHITHTSPLVKHFLG